MIPDYFHFTHACCRKTSILHHFRGYNTTSLWFCQYK